MLKQAFLKIKNVAPRREGDILHPYLQGQWIFGEAFCRFHGLGMFTFGGLASHHTMGIIAVSRYFCVVRPEKYIVLFKKQRTLMYVAVVWCVALIGSVPPFFFEHIGFEFQPGKAMCLYTFDANIAYTIFIECVYIATPLSLIAFCYSKVFYTVSRSNRVFSYENNPQQLRAFSFPWFRSVHVWTSISPHHGYNRSESLFLCRETGKVHRVIQKTTNFDVHSHCMVCGFDRICPSIFLRNIGFEFQPGKAMYFYTFDANIAYTIFIECVYIATLLTLITFCYSKVFYTVSRSNRVFSYENNPQQQSYRTKWTCCSIWNNYFIGWIKFIDHPCSFMAYYFPF